MPKSDSTTSESFRFSERQRVAIRSLDRVACARKALLVAEMEHEHDLTSSRPAKAPTEDQQRLIVEVLNRPDDWVEVRLDGDGVLALGDHVGAEEVRVRFDEAETEAGPATDREWAFVVELETEGEPLYLRLNEVETVDINQARLYRDRGSAMTHAVGLETARVRPVRVQVILGDEQPKRDGAE